MKNMSIGRPYILDEGNYFKLCTDIKRDDCEDFTLFFEIEREYKEFCSTDVSDGFLVSTIPYAMEFKFNIHATSISSDIYYNLKENFIPVLATFQPYFSLINLTATDVVNYSHHRGSSVGTGISCGVDSLYTVLSHIRSSIPDSHRLTHLVIMNAGSCSSVGGGISYDWFSRERDVAKKIAKELGVKLISIHTNLMEFYKTDHAHSGTMRMAGCILALDKLIGRYYLASGYDIADFKFDNDDAKYAFFSLSCASTSNLTFYLTGNSVSRDKRVEYISDFAIAHKYLNVCWNGFGNCGKCEKCLRTIGSLYSIHKLDNFSEAFDLSDFYQHKTMRVGKMRYYSKSQSLSLYGFLKKIKNDEPLLYFKSCFISMFIYTPWYSMKRFLRMILPRFMIEKLKKLRQIRKDSLI